jgi:hypothetical protein
MAAKLNDSNTGDDGPHKAISTIGSIEETGHGGKGQNVQWNSSAPEVGTAPWKREKASMPDGESIMHNPKSLFGGPWRTSTKAGKKGDPTDAY